MAYLLASDIIAYGGFGTTDDEVLLTLLLANATAIIETYTGRDFNATSDDVATRRYSYHKDLIYDEEYGKDVLLLDKDLAAITTDGLVIGTDTVFATDFMVIPTNDAPYYGILLHPNATASWRNGDSDGHTANAIQVTGTWGYSVTPPNDIKQACYRLVGWLYDQRTSKADLDRPLLTDSGVTIMPMQMPHDVLSMLKPYRRVTLRG